ncbi:Protein METHYLENE BLUE SENSITIVITY 2 [Castilleja foliolosa]|uniref:Protein METHYLENE BLUE SENSITIVITY 2 n=1 Tax=Castilleja foliolosa TaxID=1961234 RepID=A0ABD3CKJ9_9LAMI
MTGKAEPKKHTAKELAAKVDAALTNWGGGKAGLIDHSGLEKGGHTKLECPLCKVTAPDIKTMQIHHDVRHPKIPSTSPSLIIITPLSMLLLRPPNLNPASAEA